MGECLTPISIKTEVATGVATKFHLVNYKTIGTVPVPCGKCPECLARKISQWSYRLMQEDKVSNSSAFITLTYDTRYVPISKGGRMEVSKRDVQLFFKRLRKAHTSEGIEGTIKYFAVSEYGTRTHRPHYHILLFNAKLELIQPAWGMGDIHYGDVSGASIGYTLKYMMKSAIKKGDKTDDRTREFRLMSKGLGESYLTEAMKAWHKKKLEERTYVNLKDGRKVSMPRYYKDKIYTELEREKIAIKHKQQSIKKQEEEMLKDGIDYFYKKSVKAEYLFKKMHRNSIKERQKI